MLDIALLLVLIVVTMLLFRRKSRVAGALFLPYVLWVAYASTLNYGIWRMN